VSSRFRLKPSVVKMVENDVESGCLDVLRLKGYWPIRLHAGTFKSLDGKRFVRGVEKGTPDWAAFKAPGFLMEVKRPGGALTAEQHEKICELERFWGLETIVVDGVEELFEWLERRDRSP
jgi:hypothetical protein